MGAVSLEADKVLVPRDRHGSNPRVGFYRGNSGQGNTQQTPR